MLAAKKFTKKSRDIETAQNFASCTQMRNPRYILGFPVGVQGRNFTQEKDGKPRVFIFHRGKEISGREREGAITIRFPGGGGGGRRLGMRAVPVNFITSPLSSEPKANWESSISREFECKDRKKITTKSNFLVSFCLIGAKQLGFYPEKKLTEK